jgi:hypothetical protein
MEGTGLMKCSDCKQDIRPVVALDIDGTLADWHTAFFNFAERYLDRPMNHSFDGSMELSDYLAINKRLYHEMKLAFRAGGFKRWMLAYDGAKYISDCLKAMDVETWITTTRPWMRMDSVDPDTREWLRRNGIVFHGLLYDEDKYDVLISRVGRERIAAILEDQPDQFGRAKELELPVIHRRTNWNSAIHLTPNVSTLFAAQRLIKTQVNQWYVRYGSEQQLEAISGT